MLCHGHYADIEMWVLLDFVDFVYVPIEANTPTEEVGPSNDST